jgi:hypothetical protein
MLAERSTTAESTQRITLARSAFGQWARLAVAISLGLALLLALALTPAEALRSSVAEVAPAQVAALEARWGIRITTVAFTAGGGFLDVRFKAIDPEKAHLVTDPASGFAIIDQASGIVADKGGAHGHRAAMKAGSTYYLLYQNPGGAIKPGSRVTIRIGDVLLENVIVQ